MGRLSRWCGQVATLAALGWLVAGCTVLRVPWVDAGDREVGPDAVSPAAPAPVAGGLAAVRIRVAENALRNRDFETAERLFREAQEAAPDAAGPLVGLGEALYAQRRHGEASILFHAALDRDGQSRAAREGLAKVLIATGKYAEARRLLEAMPLAQATASFLNKLGVARDLAGDGGAAQEAYRAALRADPGNLSVRNNLALSLAISGRHDEAAREMEHVVAASGTDQRYRANLAFVYGLGGNFTALEQAGGMADPFERSRLDDRYARIRALAAAGDRATVLALLGNGGAAPEPSSHSTGEKKDQDTEEKGIVSSESAALPSVALAVEEASPSVPSQAVSPSGRSAVDSEPTQPAPPAAPASRTPSSTEKVDRTPGEMRAAEKTSPAMPQDGPESHVAVWRVQLAAYRTLAHVTRGRGLFLQALGDLLPAIEAFERRGSQPDAGEIAYRLRSAPLADRAAAAQLCAALQDRGTACLVVQHTAELWKSTG